MIQTIQSKANYLSQAAFAKENPEAFWNEVATNFSWIKPADKTLTFSMQEASFEWFAGAELNITLNCLDRHVEATPNKVAIQWEPSAGAGNQALSYKHLLERVCQLANLLRFYGVQKGDRVCIYMPMIPDVLVSMLACARIGAVHSVVFAGFSAQSLADRLEDSEAKILISAQTLNRGDKKINLKPILNEALTKGSSVEKVLLFGNDVHCENELEIKLADELLNYSTRCDAEIMQAEDPLFILYTSGSTGKPKGVVHTCAGYMVYAGYSFQQVFQTDSNSVFWCTADVGWITGHSYLCYGPLLQGVTQIMFEGVPTYPNPGRFWEIIAKYRVSHFYTAPTAIRALMTYGDEWPEKHDLSSLQIIGSVGEPINEEAWQWYFSRIGKAKCAVVDTWWQTENGGIMISSFADKLQSIPSFAGYPLPGIQAVLLDKEGNEIQEANTEGMLCVAFPWPGMLRTVYKDHTRCKQTYFMNYPGYYFTGDGAKRDDEGRFRILGRVDDVLNVSGHRFGTAEIENAINQHPLVAESAVVGFQHDIKGQAIYAFVICNTQQETDVNITTEINACVAKSIGKIALADKIQLVSALPKTRSGKIMRRILRKIANNELDSFGDTSTLLDPLVVDEIVLGRL